MVQTELFPAPEKTTAQQFAEHVEYIKEEALQLLKIYGLTMSPFEVAGRLQRELADIQVALQENRPTKYKFEVSDLAIKALAFTFISREVVKID